MADALCGYLKVEPGQVSAGGEFTVEHAPCLGLCDHAPALLVGEVAMGPAISRDSQLNSVRAKLKDRSALSAATSAPYQQLRSGPLYFPYRLQ